MPKCVWAVDKWGKADSDSQTKFHLTANLKVIGFNGPASTFCFVFHLLRTFLSNQNFHVTFHSASLSLQA